MRDSAVFRRQQSTVRIARGEVWRVCVLEFVLEWGAFYSPFATATISYEKPVFHPQKAFALK